MIDGLLFPRTDAGVLAQVVVLVVLTGVGAWLARRRPEVRLVVTGAGLLLLALAGLRAAH